MNKFVIEWVIGIFVLIFGVRRRVVVGVLCFFNVFFVENGVSDVVCGLYIVY